MQKTLLLLLFFSITLSCQPQKEGLLIATAANMQFVMKELTQVFEAETSIPCQVSISSSGKLTAQIKEGAPFDIFLSADMKFPQELQENKLSLSEPSIYAYGELVLWGMGKIPPSIENLSDEKVKHIALANPKTAPYGSAAEAVLMHFSLLEKVKDKLVFGESIAQTNQFISTGAAEMGFTAKSVVVSPQILGKGKWIAIDPSLYPPIAQGIVLLKNGKASKEQAQKFYDFLFSAKGKEILNKFGYSVDN
ncbi:molybdate ABC transporter substrate-binding protein [Flammeovirgaceae bacterium SG7u.111]|nr:molybdate ABC transporter substrate-binding protein [Flammeovirgaceae bacterium SG7u.132]WPO36185.1 molybdate ABC transporter substrate-binding protein [Flammeovirgaceae bacterium SG7u.111]